MSTNKMTDAQILAKRDSLSRAPMGSWSACALYNSRTGQFAEVADIKASDTDFVAGFRAAAKKLA